MYFVEFTDLKRSFIELQSLSFFIHPHISFILTSTQLLRTSIHNLMNLRMIRREKKQQIQTLIDIIFNRFPFFCNPLFAFSLCLYDPSLSL